MAEGNQTPEPRRIGRRELLRLGGSATAGGLLGFLLGRQNPEPSSQQPVATLEDALLTPEQQDKRDSIYALRDFMNQYTNSDVVNNFLADASADEIRNAFTLGVVGKIVNTGTSLNLKAWQLNLPNRPTDSESIPSISFILKKFNPAGIKESQIDPNFEDQAEIRVFLDKHGNIRPGVTDKELQDGDYLTENEAKFIFAGFVKGSPYDRHFQIDAWTPELNRMSQSVVYSDGHKLTGIVERTGATALILSTPVTNIPLHPTISYPPNST